MLAEADAGHGYAPVWSPDGRTIAYIHRENPESNRATFYANALHSNIYLADVVTGAITPLTNFTGSLVYDPVWSPDGRQLAYTAQDAVWLQTPGQSPEQISPVGTTARHPAWLVSVNDE